MASKWESFRVERTKAIEDYCKVKEKIAVIKTYFLFQKIHQLCKVVMERIKIKIANKKVIDRIKKRHKRMMRRFRHESISDRHKAYIRFSMNYYSFVLYRTYWNNFSVKQLILRFIEPVIEIYRLKRRFRNTYYRVVKL